MGSSEGGGASLLCYISFKVFKTLTTKRVRTTDFTGLSILIIKKNHYSTCETAIVKKKDEILI